MAAAYDYIPASQALSMAVLSGFALAVLCIMSQMSLSVGALNLPFLFLPTLGLYLWPQGSNSVASLILVFVLGLLQDTLSFGPSGLWPVTWLIVFLIYRPDRRSKPATFFGSWAGALMILIAVVLFQTLLGIVLLRHPVDIGALISTGVTAFFIFPGLYVVREYLARSFGNRDSFYYEAPSK